MPSKPPPPYRPQPFDLVIVTWVDAYDAPTGLYDAPADAVRAYSPAVRKQIGYYCGQTKDVTVVASSDDRSSPQSTAVGGMTYIPAGMVRSVDPAVSAPKKAR